LLFFYSTAKKRKSLKNHDVQKGRFIYVAGYLSAFECTKAASALAHSYDIYVCKLTRIS